MTAPILYDYFRSSASYRVRIALNLKGISYDHVPTSLLAGDQRSDEYRAINPQGFVPALIDDGMVVTQSLAIIDWIDRKWPEPLLFPDEPKSRAAAMSFALAIACDIHPLNNLRVLKYLQTQLGLRDDIRDNWYRHWIVEGFRSLEPMAAAIVTEQDSGQYLGGARMNIADICLVPQMYNARRFYVDLEEFPTLVRIDAACQLVDAVAAAHPDVVKPAD